MIFLSSNAFSADDQTADVLSYLSNSEDSELVAMADRFTDEFPEYNSLEWSGSWVDTEASGVDVEYMSWVRDWIEANTPVSWWEGEPVMDMDDDDDDDDDSSSRRNVMVLYRETHDDGDKFGSVMSYLFPLAEILRRNGEHVSGYAPSMAESGSDVPAEYGEDTVTTELWDALNGESPYVDGFTVTLDAVRYAYGVLSRYRDALERAGEAY